MNFFAKMKNRMPSAQNVLFTLVSAVLLIQAFPDFELWLLAWVCLAPFFLAIEREKSSPAKGFLLGWLWGVAFFFGTCWWLAYAPTHYGGVPAVISYFLVFCASVAAGLFPALFAALLSFLLKRFGNRALLAAPFLWTATEFLRFWLTGNNWNAIAYSQAFNEGINKYAAVGGIYLVGFTIVFANTFIFLLWFLIAKSFLISKNGWSFSGFFETVKQQFSNVKQRGYWTFGFLLIFLFQIFIGFQLPGYDKTSEPFYASPAAFVIAIQPNVPMSGLRYEDWQKLRQRHVELSESAFDANIEKFVEAQTAVHSKDETKDKEFYTEFIRKQFNDTAKVVIFPESPMNFRYERDPQFRSFVRDFASHNDSYVLFNSAEPDPKTDRYFNSAVMVNPRGEKIAQYDKIFLLPFGEYAPVPEPLQSLVPTMVGNFSFGTEYDLLPFGEAKGGVMICFESHFPNLSREYAKRGADVLIEMTNDGYLGNTPVLRQHLASAVFRAIETNRPVVRVTNVGVTAYINERGEIFDAAESYTEATRVWKVSKSDGEQTFYVKYGDWFAYLCSIVSLVLLGLSFRRKEEEESDK
jgi:apolipoprotein N-acyltransferase